MTSFKYGNEVERLGQYGGEVTTRFILPVVSFYHRGLTVKAASTHHAGNTELGVLG